MSYFPDCRTDEAYNEKYLNENDSAEIKGFDWCAEEVVDNFFDNLDIIDDEAVQKILDTEIGEDLRNEYTVEFRFGGGEETRQIRTVADLLRAELCDWIEHERNELITSMIDGMDDAEYNRIKEKVDGQSESEN